VTICRWAGAGKTDTKSNLALLCEYRMINPSMKFDVGADFEMMKGTDLKTKTFGVALVFGDY
jgi:hypothetical protein